MYDDFDYDPSEEEIDEAEGRAEEELDDKLRLERLGYSSWEEYKEDSMAEENDGSGQ